MKFHYFFEILAFFRQNLVIFEIKMFMIRVRTWIYDGDVYGTVYGMRHGLEQS